MARCGTMWLQVRLIWALACSDLLFGVVQVCLLAMCGAVCWTRIWRYATVAASCSG